MLKTAHYLQNSEKMCELQITLSYIPIHSLKSSELFASLKLNAKASKLMQITS